jgi:2,3,4,5-tetrahydropyridine-2-carboxylate N-succinyltransferase
MINQNTKISQIIENAFEKRAEINWQSSDDNIQEIRHAVNEVIDQLDSGKLKICYKNEEKYQVNQWVKKAILLSFRLNDNFLSKQKNISGDSISFYDKVSLKFANWNEDDFKKSGFRALPGSVVRRGSYIGKNVVLMPSFVNIGAYVDDSTMVDTWSTIGSCAQIGKNCHISGGVGIGGVLEPLQSNPVIIEDDCFIGARSEIAEGVIVEKGSVISMGVYIGASTKIIDRSTGEIIIGRVPAYSVVVSGTMASENNKDKNLSLYCAVIVKKVDEKTRSKTSINELLRD